MLILVQLDYDDTYGDILAFLSRSLPDLGAFGASSCAVVYARAFGAAPSKSWRTTGTRLRCVQKLADAESKLADIRQFFAPNVIPGKLEGMRPRPKGHPALRIQGPQRADVANAALRF